MTIEDTNGHTLEASETLEPAKRPSAKEEQRRMALAPTFDRLIDANLDLTRAVDRLVKVSYLTLATTLALGTLSLVRHL